MLPILFGGIFFGFIIFTFTFIASKSNGKYYMAPIFTFLLAILITAYGLFVIGGFEGMAYGFLAIGFLIISIAGTLLLPLFIRKGDAQQFRKSDKVGLAVLPILFFAAIALVIYTDEGYWLIDKGTKSYVQEENGMDSYYRVSTILEGRKQVTLILGDEYTGKEIKVDSVSKWGPTEITVEIADGGKANQSPYITIGLDEIKEPLTVQTTDGVEFKSAVDRAAEK